MRFHQVLGAAGIYVFALLLQRMVPCSGLAVVLVTPFSRFLD